MLDDADRINARYRPVAFIGRGGMAEVLLAVMDAGGGCRKMAVLKRLWPDLAEDPDFVTMFRDEARLAIRLNHPNVVQTYEVVEGAQRMTIAMEYLHGQALTGVLDRLGGPRELGLSLRLRIVSEVLAGLHYAHELADYDGGPLGLVHRDVSPHNVFVGYDGHVKLVDFGVAKTMAASHQTRPGAIKGKLAYMAPEQLQSANIDRRADIFSVGVMLWELLAGRRLWHGLAEPAIVHHLASGFPMPDLPEDFSRPAALDAICRRALAVDPDRRPATAAEMGMEIERLLAGAADSHARNLGRIVSAAFAAVRAEREALIAQCLRGEPVAAVPTIDALPAPAEAETRVERVSLLRRWSLVPAVTGVVLAGAMLAMGTLRSQRPGEAAAAVTPTAAVVVPAMTARIVPARKAVVAGASQVKAPPARLVVLPPPAPAAAPAIAPPADPVRPAPRSARRHWTRGAHDAPSPRRESVADSAAAAAAADPFDLALERRRQTPSRPIDDSDPYR